MTLYAIEDGWFDADPAVMFPKSDPAAWAPHIGESGMLRISIGCFVVVEGSKSTLIDTGMGSRPVPGGRSGQLPQALALIGTRPEDVANVIHTHMHADHTGGNMLQPGQPMFPNATHRVQAAELDHWANATGEVAERARAMIEPLVEAGKVATNSGDADIVPGISVVSTPGHTPGHQSVVLSSAGARAVITVDVIHQPLQATHPEWGVTADLDPARANESRAEMVSQLTGSGIVLAGGHFPRPGMGYLETSGEATVFVAGTTVQVA